MKTIQNVASDEVVSIAEDMKQLDLSKQDTIISPIKLRIGESYEPPHITPPNRAILTVPPVSILTDNPPRVYMFGWGVSKEMAKSVAHKYFPKRVEKWHSYVTMNTFLAVHLRVLTGYHHIYPMCALRDSAPNPAPEVDWRDISDVERTLVVSFTYNRKLFERRPTPKQMEILDHPKASPLRHPQVPTAFQLS
ncbi:hypothetical protein ABKN59_006419 [Abortiporus biennis]